MPTKPGTMDSALIWGPRKRLAFRFCFLYFGLYVLVTQMLSSLFLAPSIDVPEIGTLRPLRAIISWAAAHIFHHQAALVVTGSGSGDKTFDWVESFCLLLMALGVTAIWSLADRKRLNYSAVFKWFHLFLRFAVGSTMFAYGFDKAIPLQMSFPSLTRLIEPFGDFSPMGVLWASIGASTGYEIFAGCAEILGGVLILIPRTATLGALVCVADMTQVFLLNMTYDVPVKLFSFHLILMCLFLLGPEAARLFDFFFRNQPVSSPKPLALFQTVRANRFAFFAQIGILFYLVSMNIYGGLKAWKEYGGGAPKSELYGIWNVDEFIMDGQLHPPLLTDTPRWRRIVFQSPTSATFQKMDDTFVRYASAVQLSDKSLILRDTNEKEPKAKLSFQRNAPGQLLLDGVMDGHAIRLRLQLVEREKYLLVNRSFHWIQEYPFNR